VALKQRAAPRRRKLPSEWKPVPLPNERGLLIPSIANAFAELDVSAALWISEQYWLAIHERPGVVTFERDLNVMPRRWAYNERCFARVLRDERAHVGEHAGFKDWFVPVRRGGEIRAVLVVGPYAVARPTPAEVARRFRELGGEHAHVSDPMFSRYLETTNATLTLEGSLAALFQRFLAAYARLLGDEGETAELARELAEMRHRLRLARLPERVWDATRLLVDERGGRPVTLLDHGEMAAFGIEQMPRHALVGLCVARRDATDPVAHSLNRAAFQRAAAILGTEQRALCGRVGEHAVVLLLDHTGPSARARAALTELAARVSTLARRFDLRLHVGIAEATRGAPLSALYRAASRAAEKALAEGESLALAEPGNEGSTAALAKLRLELGKTLGTSPNVLSLRFGRYADAVVAHSSYRLDRVRIELEVGLAALTDPVARSQHSRSQELRRGSARALRALGRGDHGFGAGERVSRRRERVRTRAT
jgi:hypothetical protein